MQTFSKPRLLIVGCGDIGLRVVKQLSTFYRIFALTSQRERFQELRSLGVMPIFGDLDMPDSLSRLKGLAGTVIHLAPPQNISTYDYRTRNLVRILSQGSPGIRRLVYVSTTGVYGDCQGARVCETTPINPQNDRAHRRADAERVLRSWAIKTGATLSILRVPGIYSADRLPIERLKSKTPALLSDEDAYSNHIHSDDLARLICAAIFHGRPQRTINACDGDEMKMGDYFDQVADAFSLVRPQRLPAVALQKIVNPMLWSFMRESRRVQNPRLSELRIKLRYPSVTEFLKTISRNPLNQQRD